MATFKDVGDFVFKIKTIQMQNKNIGAKAEDAAKQTIIKKLNEIWGQDVYQDTELKKFELAIIIEFLTRFLTDEGTEELIPEREPDNMVYFFDPERAIINSISEKSK
jgi:hypothetical protein